MKVASIEWLRIVATVCVLLFHFQSFYFEINYFEHFAVVVDFFFMLSGFLLYKSSVKKPISSLRFALRKAKSFYAPYVLAFFMVFVITMFINNVNQISEILLRLFHYKWELILLQMAAFNPHPEFGVDYLVGSAWYLSAMVLMVIPVYYLVTYQNRLYINIIAPVSVIFIYGFIMQSFETMNIGNEVVGFVMSGNLRAFAGLSLGCICYHVYRWAKEKEWRKSIIVGLNVLEVSSVIAIACLLILRNFIAPADELFWVPVFCLLIFTSFSGKTVISKFLNNHFTELGYYLGSLSLYLYLFHWFFVLLFANYIDGLGFWSSQILYVICVVVFSAIAMWCFQGRKEKVE